LHNNKVDASTVYTKEASDTSVENALKNYYTKTDTDTLVDNIIWSGTQEQYDELETKNNDTLYIITDGIDDGNTISYYTKSEIDATVAKLDTSINNNDSSIATLMQTINDLSTALDQALARINALENPENT
jgi:hypothetical protein